MGAKNSAARRQTQEQLRDMRSLLKRLRGMQLLADTIYQERRGDSGEQLWEAARAIREAAYRASIAVEALEIDVTQLASDSVAYD